MYGEVNMRIAFPQDSMPARLGGGERRSASDLLIGPVNDVADANKRMLVAAEAQPRIQESWRWLDACRLLSMNQHADVVHQKLITCGREASLACHVGPGGDKHHRGLDLAIPSLGEVPY